jgi:hypothetical protein
MVSALRLRGLGRFRPKAGALHLGYEHNESSASTTPAPPSGIDDSDHAAAGADGSTRPSGQNGRGAASSRPVDDAAQQTRSEGLSMTVRLTHLKVVRALNQAMVRSTLEFLDYEEDKAKGGR